MKQIILFVVILFFATTACKPKPKPGPKPKQTPEEIITDAKLETLSILDKKIAEELIINVKSVDAEKDYAVLPINKSDWGKLFSITEIDSIKIIRASFSKMDPNASKMNKPTTLIALQFRNAGGTASYNDILFLESREVCPPPDGSTCLTDHLYQKFP